MADVTADQVVGQATDLPEEEELIAFQEEQASIEEEFGLEDSNEEGVTEEKKEEVPTETEVDEDGNSAWDRHQLERYFSPDFIDPNLVPESLERTEDSVLGASIRQNNALYRLTKNAAMNYLTDNNKEDDSFNVLEEYKKIQDEFPGSREQNYLFKANNPENFMSRVFQLRDDNRDRLTLSQNGAATTFAAGAISAVVDIDMLIPQLAIAKLASKSVRVGNLVNRLGKVGTGMASGAAANLVTGIGLQKTDPSYTDGDLVMDTILGTSLGGFFGGLQRGHFTAEQLNKIDGVEIKANGEVNIKDLDTVMDSQARAWNNIDKGGDHSLDSTMPVSSYDSVLRAYAMDKKINKMIGEAKLTRGRVTQIAEAVEKEFGKEFRITKAERKGILTEAKAAARKGLAPEDVYDQLSFKSELYRKHFGGEKSPAMERFLTSGTDIEAPTKVERPLAEGEAVVEEVTEVEAGVVREQVAEGKEVRLDPKELDVINKTLRSNHRKGIKQIEDLTYSKAGEPFLKLRDSKGNISKYSGENAKQMLNNLRDLVIADYDSGLARTTNSTRVAANKRFLEVIRNVPEIFTDFSKVLKEDKSITLKKFGDDMLVSALGDNLIGGTSVHTIKEGVMTEMSHGYSLMFDATRKLSNQRVNAKSKKSVILNNDLLHADLTSEVDVNKEITGWLNDMYLGKTDEAVVLKRELDGLMEKYYDRGSSLVKDEALTAECQTIADRAGIDVQIARALLGQKIMASKTLDMMVDVPKNNLRAKAVEGAESIEDAEYVGPQYVSSQKMEDLRLQGHDEKEIIRATQEFYTSGILQKGEAASEKEARDLAKMVAKGAIGRAWAPSIDRQASIAANNAFAESITEFINNNPKLPERTKGVLLNMESRLREDALESTFLKDRVPFDRTMEIEVTKLDGTTTMISGQDIMKVPDNSTWQMYMNRASGEIALASKGWDRRTIINNRKLIKEELKQGGAPNKDIQFYTDMYDATIANTQGQPNPQSTRMGNWGKVNLLKRLFNLNALGGVGLAQATESAVAVSHVGAINAVRRILGDYMPKVTKKQALKDAAILEDLMTSRSVIEDMESTAFQEMEDFGRAQLSDKAHRVLTVSEEVHRKVTLAEPIKAKQRIDSWTIALDSIVNKLDKGSKNDLARLRQMQVDEHFTKILDRLFDTGILYRDKGTVRWNRPGVDIAEVLTRDDRIKFTGVLRSVEKNDFILRPQAGSADFRLANPLIGVFTHLKTYPMFSVNNVFLKNLRYADANTASLFLSTAMASYIATYLKAYAYGQDVEDIGAMDAFFRYNSALGAVGMGIDGIANITNTPSMRISPDYGRNNSMQIPLIQQLDALYGLGSLPFDVIENGGITSNNLRDIKRSVPIYNLFTAYGINSYGNHLREEEARVRKEERAIESQRRRQERIGTIGTPAGAEKQERNKAQEAVETLQSFNIGE